MMLGRRGLRVLCASFLFFSISGEAKLKVSVKVTTNVSPVYMGTSVTNLLFLADHGANDKRNVSGSYLNLGVRPITVAPAEQAETMPPTSYPEPIPAY